MPEERKPGEETGDDLAHGVQNLGQRTADRAEEMANQQKAMGAERVEHVAEALRSSAEQLAGNEEQLADLVDTAAAQLEGFARSLREKDFPALVAEAEEFGRRQPAVFMGAALALGFGLARFAKAGTQRGETRHDHRTESRQDQGRAAPHRHDGTSPSSPGSGYPTMSEPVYGTNAERGSVGPAGTVSEPYHRT